MTKEAINAPFRFSISATFTADPLRPFIAFWGRQLNSNFETRFAPFNQVVQTLLDPSSEFGANTHGVNIILARLEDFGQVDSDDSLQKLESNVSHLVQELRVAPERLSAPLVFCLAPSSPAFLESPERAACAARLNRVISAALDESPGVQFLHYEQIGQFYAVDLAHDPEGERLGKIPYTELYYCALATALVRQAHGLFMAPFKMIALDCDNTLWQGICGEDGPKGVTLDSPRRKLQEFMVDQREAGMLLTMASKNNEDDVLETFRAHPEMPLRLRHFVAWRLNWDPKAENLAQLSEELALGLDSFVFVDDNAKECAELQQAIPEVLTLALPEVVDEIPHFLCHVWAFDHPVITEEDRNRNVYYAQQQEFGSEVRRASSLEEFMASLGLRVTVLPVSPDKLARVAQLTQRTNQFNFTTIRRSESELQDMLREGYDIYTVEVTDRFGDYGLVGVMMVQSLDDELRVDTFLLSCRALGRGVEHRMLAFLGQTATARGVYTVVLRYERTVKNSPASQFVETIRFREVQPAGDGHYFRLPAPRVAEFKWTPAAVTAPAAPKVQRTTSSPLHSIDYARIARNLSTPERILAAMHAESAPVQSLELMTDVERQLSIIWASLLERSSISRTDNFFDLGGHSLLAVLLLLRIRESFGVELSIDDVYSGTLTLADLAARIEAAQLGDIDPEGYAALLAEIENMSDEEASALLARETGQA